MYIYPCPVERNIFRRQFVGCHVKLTGCKHHESAETNRQKKTRFMGKWKTIRDRLMILRLENTPGNDPFGSSRKGFGKLPPGS